MSYFIVQDNCFSAAVLPSMTSSSNENEILGLFRSKFEKTGVALTSHQLLEACKKAKINPTPSLGYLQQLIRLKTAAGGVFAKPPSSKQPSQSVGVAKAGVYFIDYGEFHKSWAGSNNGCTGFLVAVENLTNKLFVEPTKGKDTRQWLNSIAKFVENTRDVQLVYSDRDAVATSPSFRQGLVSKYGIRWHFLKKGNKSFLAERYIAFVKKKLSQALLGNNDDDANDKGKGKGKGKKRWIDYVPAICQTYNDQIVPGTKLKRSAIGKHNFDLFIERLFGESAANRHSSFKAGPFETESWNRAVFKFQLGDRVRVLRTLDGKQAGGSFAKNSIEGAYSTRVFTVAGRQLRANRLRTRLVPVYSLAELGERHLHFYQHELSRVGRNNGRGHGQDA